MSNTYEANAATIEASRKKKGAKGAGQFGAHPNEVPEVSIEPVTVTVLEELHTAKAAATADAAASYVALVAATLPAGAAGAKFTLDGDRMTFAGYLSEVPGGTVPELDPKSTKAFIFNSVANHQNVRDTLEEAGGFHEWRPAAEVRHASYTAAADAHSRALSAGEAARAEFNGKASAYLTEHMPAHIESITLKFDRNADGILVRGVGAVHGAHGQLIDADLPGDYRRVLDIVDPAATYDPSWDGIHLRYRIVRL